MATRNLLNLNTIWTCPAQLEISMNAECIPLSGRSPYAGVPAAFEDTKRRRTREKGRVNIKQALPGFAPA